MPDPIKLDGLDGANPLGFLAALGTLVLADHIWPGAQMQWECEGVISRPRLSGVAANNTKDLADSLVKKVREDFSEGDPAYIYGDIIACEPGFFRSLSMHHIVGGETDIAVSRLLTGYGSDIRLQDKGKQEGLITPTFFSLANRQSGKHLLHGYRSLVIGAKTKTSSYPSITVEALHRALTELWRFDEDHEELRWGPNEFRPGALSRPSATTHGGNLLAFWSLAMLASFPTTRELITASAGSIDGKNVFTWPLWDVPLAVDTVRSVLTLPELQERQVDHKHLRARGIRNVWRSVRFPYQKGIYFSEAVAV